MPSRGRHWIGWTVAGVCAALLVGTLLLVDRHVPAQHLPWKRLDPDAPLGFATRGQLMRVALSPSATCADLAERSALVSRPADPRNAPGPCGWQIAREVSVTGSVPIAETPMQCPLALATHIWLAEVDRLARAQLGTALVGVDQFGSYSCRRQRGNGSGRWSEHAFANAWDVSAFRFADGSRIRILADWVDPGPRGAFLKSARDAACDVFRVTLSPDYNVAHADHLHLDMGPVSACR